MKTLRRIAFRLNPFKPAWMRSAIQAWQDTGNKVVTCAVVKHDGHVHELTRAVNIAQRIADAYPR